MRRLFLLVLLVCFSFFTLGTQLAVAAEHCAVGAECPKTGLGALLKGKVKIELKRLPRKRAVVKKRKPKIIKKRKQKIAKKPKRRISKKKKVLAKRRVVRKNRVVRKKRKPRKPTRITTPAAQVGPSWEGLRERKVHFLGEKDLKPISTSFIIRFNAVFLRTQNIDMETITRAELAGLLGIQAFQVRSVQRRFLLGAILNLSDADRIRIAASNLVLRLTPDTVIKPATKAKLSWGLDRINQIELPLDNMFERHPPRGNVRVYLVDSGVDATHPQFGNRIKPGARFVPTIPATLESYCRQHGTEMASLITGETLGVAPRVSVIDVTILPCDNDETGKASSLIEGLSWIIDRELSMEPRKLALVNLSLTGPKSLDVNDWIDVLVDNGIGVVVAAGNQGQDACDFSPASAAKAITVGAVQSDDSRWKHSNYGSCVNIFAPGDKVTTAFAEDHNMLVASSGTSAAAAHATGILANNIVDMEPGKPMQQLLSSGVMLKRKSQGASEMFVQFEASIRADCYISRKVKRLKLRDQPHASGRALGVLYSGETLELALVQGNWASVRTPSGLTGWAAVKTKSKIYLVDKSGKKACGDVTKTDR